MLGSFLATCIPYENSAKGKRSYHLSNPPLIRSSVIEQRLRKYPAPIFTPAKVINAFLDWDLIGALGIVMCRTTLWHCGSTIDSRGECKGR